jgi:prepilin-type N-terminal cleavage/methylation domain-containing protein
MKKSTTSSRANKGFTLIELLVVIAIISILAAMLMTAINTAKIKVQVTRATLQTSQIATAIHDYEAAYNRFPVAPIAMNSVAATGDDFTYGGIFKTPSGMLNVYAAGNHPADNSEVMAVLLNLEKFNNGQPTVNAGHVMNTQPKLFLNATMTSDANAPGVGPDGVYRDPWGNPYVISIDVNNDERTRDAFYQKAAVSQDPANPNGGLNGLIKRTVPNGTIVFEVNSPVTVWSAGPDKMIDATVPANKGANKDNIVSWK